MFGSLLTGFDGNVFEDFRRLEREMDRLFYGGREGPSGIRAVRPGTFPPMNIGATPDRVHVYLFAAGLDPKSIDLSLQQNVLSISGSRSTPQPDEQAAYYRRERFEGEFRRVVTLPEDIDPDRVEAKYRDGVLQITVERRETARPRQISVN